MPELSTSRRYLVLAICCMSILIVGLETTVLNVALPSLQEDLGSSVSGLQWALDSYTLVLASLLMLSGSTGDRIGRRRTFQTGLTIFVLGSALCSLAPDLGWLIVFRMVQGAGASMMNPVALSIVTNTFPDRQERARAIGIWSAVVGVSIAVGPILGGFLVDTVGWRWIFVINVPIGLLALVLTALFVPESKAGRARRIDPVGQLLVIVVLASLIYAVIEVPHLGWDSPLVIGLLAVAVIAAVGLVAYEKRRPEPLLDVRFFRSATFSGATLIALTAFAAFAGCLFVNTLYLQNDLGLTPFQAGLHLLPMALVVMALAPISGRMVGAYGTRPSLVIGGLGMVAGTVALTFMEPGQPRVLLLGSYALFGIGFGFLNAPITATAVSGMPPSQAGLAAAVASTSRQVGTCVGVAVVGSVYTAALGADPDAASRLSAAHTGWWVVAGSALLALVVGVATSGKWARDSAERTAAGLAAESLTPESGTTRSPGPDAAEAVR
ncbi:DHA2 family efflux MFS transporter permease subunit [Kineosporia sp. J2-2]|uniref:DHA2 family efflux MFS transporter permease subunit n=1 Tax=Kineosporia corallincola TaxID=2835133 RepID=A0ABS5TD65_9ACTN|nr:DHA2 family efflux MFS transporter permease subunit [Kineosporia corallincola]MBT0768981.1 DHA2 family efflux MFS transporter permease subunit [Kineosporia corallincola]